MGSGRFPGAFVSARELGEPGKARHSPLLCFPMRWMQSVAVLRNPQFERRYDPS